MSDDPTADPEPTDEGAVSQDGNPTEKRSPIQELAASTDEADADLFETAFREANPEALDTEDLWDELESFESMRPEDRVGDDVTVVAKRDFCQRCPHLTDPPDVQCTHDGTEILEFADSEHVAVKDCPVVARRRGLE